MPAAKRGDSLRDGLKPLEWVWGGEQERRQPAGKDGAKAAQKGAVHVRCIIMKRKRTLKILKGGN